MQPQAASTSVRQQPAPTIQSGSGQPRIVLGDQVVLIPRTSAEVRALRERRGEISDQITNVSSRRDRIAKQLLDADPAARGGLQARLQVLDDRIVQLERELDVTGEAVRNAPSELVAATQGPSPADIANRVTTEVVPIVAILSVFVLGPMAIAFSRFIWRRAGGPSREQQVVDSQQQQRLDQLQQAVDTIAIEVERISEGQRFVTKLLTDGKAPAIGAGSDPLRTSRKAASSER